MAPRPPQHFSLDHWLRRIDRAAGRINPFLTVLAIGLAVLNLTCMALLAMRLPITHDPLGIAQCQLSAECLDTAPTRHHRAQVVAPQ